MFLDQEQLRPVILAMAIYLVVMTIVPKIAKKPTGIKVVDELIMYILAQRDQMMSGAIFVGLITLATEYARNELM
ncbi:hypothetical protein DSLPV1_199 [Dishui lake phycodnavirus 1]|uniref:hypothetical protein n=1 Tax=Dishui lake phycodnavirus 1 TaxID=2079134 RepID=UPI000CD6AA50|nr:hypothetical protein C5Y57_gp199 [Dishui lake phycodnavirus 1]AUT19170.1 hypothetical protein DSLPV1_199 [Dishui lake phycodnavirus 1]